MLLIWNDWNKNKWNTLIISFLYSYPDFISTLLSSGIYYSFLMCFDLLIRVLYYWNRTFFTGKFQVVVDQAMIDFHLSSYCIFWTIIRIFIGSLCPFAFSQSILYQNHFWMKNYLAIYLLMELIVIYYYAYSLRSIS